MITIFTLPTEWFLPWIDAWVNWAYILIGVEA